MRLSYANRRRHQHAPPPDPDTRDAKLEEPPNWPEPLSLLLEFDTIFDRSRLFRHDLSFVLREECSMNKIRIALLSALVLIPVGAGWPRRPAAAGPEDSLQQQIVAKEREELEALKSGDHQAFANLIADEAIFLDPSGSATKAEVVEHTADFRLTDYTMDGIKVVSLSATSGMLVYRIVEGGNSHGRDFSATAYVSALWAKRSSRWVCLFSQETPAR